MLVLLFGRMHLPRLVRIHRWYSTSYYSFLVDSQCAAFLFVSFGCTAAVLFISLLVDSISRMESWLPWEVCSVYTILSLLGVQVDLFKLSICPAFTNACSPDRSFNTTNNYSRISHEIERQD
jgi:hypothetical protein